jgi:hypothetical protein
MADKELKKSQFIWKNTISVNEKMTKMTGGSGKEFKAMYSSIFLYYSEIPEVGCFIKKRGLFGSQFWRFKPPHLVMAFLLAQS